MKEEKNVTECKKSQNLKSCPCTYECARKGICCECIAHHRKSDELPACYFSKEVEKTFDRSIDMFLEDRGKA
ncbi:MAG: DUF6485 family protein [Candidatus Diapherotrites archaeon]